MILDPGLFGACGFALVVAHVLCDYVLQTQHQADTKALGGLVGRLACLRHVGVQVAGAGAVVALLGGSVAGPTPTVGRCAAALAVIGVTHYFADRRAPLRALIDVIRRGRGMEWIDQHGGLAFCDQAWHYLWLGVAAWILATG